MSPVIQIRGVPDDVHRSLKRRAADEGRTLSELLRDELTRKAARPSRREVIARIASRPAAELGETRAESVRATDCGRP